MREIVNMYIFMFAHLINLAIKWKIFTIFIFIFEMFIYNYENAFNIYDYFIQVVCTILEFQGILQMGCDFQCFVFNIRRISIEFARIKLLAKYFSNSLWVKSLVIWIFVVHFISIGKFQIIFKTITILADHFDGYQLIKYLTNCNWFTMQF